MKIHKYNMNIRLLTTYINYIYIYPCNDTRKIVCIYKIRTLKEIIAIFTLRINIFQLYDFYLKKRNHYTNCRNILNYYTLHD